MEGGRRMARQLALRALRLHRRWGVLVGGPLGGRLPNGRIDPLESRPGVLRAAPGGATVHDAFPSFKIFKNN